MKHPEEIYKDINGKEMTNPERLWGEGMNRRHAYDLGHEAGYAKCLADIADPLAGYSNLTAAISAGEPIDWERLDGLKVQCVKPEVGTLRGKLERNESRTADYHAGWWDKDADSLYRSAFIYGWTEYDGWSLWVEGEIPMRRKTADQLEVGHFFTGRLSCTVRENLMCVAEEHGRGKHVRFAADFTPSRYPASEWVVLEEHGPFQKPEGK